MNKKLSKIIKNYREAEIEKNKIFNEQIEASHKDLLLEIQTKLIWLSKYFRHATLSDYKKWLEGYLEKGGNFSHYYDYDMRLDNWFVAIKDFPMQDYYGAMSIYIIIPVNLKITDTPTKFGHNEIYFMENFEALGHFIPLYKNISFQFSSQFPKPACL